MPLVRLSTVLALLAFLAAGCGDDDPVVHPDAAPLPDAPPPPPDAALPDGPPPPSVTGCNVPIDLTGAAPSMHNTQFSADQTGASCAGGSNSAPELYFLYDAGPTPVDLIVDVAVDESVPAPFDVVLSARTDCLDTGTELACTDVGWGEHMEVLAATGTVVILVDGSGEFGGVSAGEFTISVTTRPIAGVGDVCDPAGVSSRCDTDLICSGGMCEATSPTLACMDAVDLTADLADGTAQASATLLLTDPDYYQASCAFDVSANYPERLYKLDVAAPGQLVASTDDPATTFDTVVSLKAGACDAAETACDDDVDATGMNYRSSLDTHVDPGTYYLFVDTSSGFLYGTPGMTPHTFQLDLTFTPD